VPHPRLGGAVATVQSPYTTGQRLMPYNSPSDRASGVCSVRRLTIIKSSLTSADESRDQTASGLSPSFQARHQSPSKDDDNKIFIIA
jgi:hypothetical protein